MKRKRIFGHYQPFYRFLPLLALIIGFTFLTSSHAYAQAADDSAKAAAAQTVQARIERARALAAAHQLGAAAGELEALRTTAQDDSVRNVTSVMLMNIYLEDGNYTRAESMLEETFRSRTTQKDRSIRTYFALAGQAVNGARAHLARYRTFGINVSDPRLPAEASSDLDRLSSLLERMIAQAREITREDSKAYDSLALLEDVLGIRLSLARDAEDREKWENEYSGARQGLASSQTQIALLGGAPSLQAPTVKSPSVSTPTTSSPAGSKSEKSEPKASASGSNPGPVEGSPGTAAESEKSAVPETLSVGSLNSRALKTVEPSYPQAAKAAAAAGAVKVYVAVDESGKVSSIFRSEGPVLLKKAAEDAARRWKFPPMLVAGKPVRLTGYIEFNFVP